MANSKITKAMAFSAIIDFFAANPTVEIDNRAEIVDILNKEIYNLAKRKATSKPSKTQTENDGYKTAILTFLTNYGGRYTVSEFQTAVDKLAELSNQRVSAILRQMKETGVISRIEEKKKAYFFLTPVIYIDSDDEEIDS